MIILHYIPDMTSSPDGAAGFVTSLLQSTQQVATSHVVTRNDLGSNIVSFTRNFIKHVESINPDIVHVHACWDLRAAIIEKIARSKGYFTIVSPHGGLSPSVMEQEFWKKRLPRIILYQLRMMRKCKSAIVTSDKEFEDMKRLKWKHNISLVPYPSNPEDIREAVMAAYRKVIDTNYRQRLTSEEEITMFNCLKASVIPQDDKTHTLEGITQTDTNEVSFRRLYLYAYDEGVIDNFVDGAHILGIRIPPRLNFDAIPRFKVKTDVNKKELKRLNALHAILRDNPAPFTKVDLHALLTSYALIRHKDYDEDELVAQIKRHHLLKFSTTLFNHYTDIFQLEPGFIPL